MQFNTLTASALSLTLLATSAIAGGPPPKEGEEKVSYEQATYDPATDGQTGGAELNAPGDMYRMTFIIDDEFINNPDYEVSRAIMGLDMEDDDVVDGVDTAPEWGQILLDGLPRKWRHTGSVENYRDGEPRAYTNLDEIDSLTETKAPPYIFDIPALVADDGRVVLEVTNLREDGTVDSDAPYGDFIVLGAGVHVFYKKKQ